jgi:Lar family restriction alleviation protein
MKETKYIDNGGNVFMDNVLLPCPFCGGKPEILFIGNNHTRSRKVTIKCKTCRIKRTDAGLRFDHEWVARNAIKTWNKRT